MHLAPESQCGWNLKPSCCWFWTRPEEPCCQECNRWGTEIENLEIIEATTCVSLPPGWQQEPPRSWSLWQNQSPCTCSSASLGSPLKIWDQALLRFDQNDSWCHLDVLNCSKGSKELPENVFLRLRGKIVHKDAPPGMTKVNMHHSLNVLWKLLVSNMLSTRTRSRWWRPCPREENLPRGDRQPRESTWSEGFLFGTFQWIRVF